MSKKSHKALASATVMSLILTSTLTATVSAATGVERLSGSNRETTAIDVATKVFEKAETVVLVNGYKSADALSATPLAKAYNAPILSVGAVDEPTAALTKALSDLGAKKVIVVGGEGAVTKALATKLAETYTVERIEGKDRYATNVNVAKKVMELKASKEAFVVNGTDASYADALSIASIAASKGAPLVFTNGKTVSEDAKALVKDLKVTAIGGTGVVSADVLAAVDATRVGGADRFETNLEVLKAYKDVIKLDNVFVAYGLNFADALVASAAAAKTDAPVVLADKTNTKFTKGATDYIEANKAAIKNVYLVGGTGVIADSVKNSIDGIVNPVVTEFKVESLTSNNLKSVTIKFTQKVDEDSLKIEAKDFTIAKDDIKVLEDGKTVVALITEKVDQSKKTEFTISAKAKDTKEELEDVVIKHTFVDTNMPTLESAKALNAKQVELQFSEPVNMVDGDVYALYDDIKVDGKAVIAKASVNNFENRVILTLSDAMTIGSRKLEIANISDFAGFKIYPKEFSLNVVEDKSAPKVISAEVKNKTTVRVEFDEPVEVTGDFKVNGDAVKSATAVKNTNNKKFDLELDKELGISAIVEVKIQHKAQKDILDNEVKDWTNFIIKVADDTTLPQVSVKVEKGNKLVLTFTKSMDKKAGTIKLLDKDKKEIQRVEVKDLTFKDDSDDKVLEYTFSKLSNIDPADYYVNIKGMKDSSIRNNEMPEETISFKAIDTKAPTVADNFIYENKDKKHKFTILFSEVMDKDTLKNTSNYSFDGKSLAVISAEISNVKVEPSSDGKKVVITIPESDKFTVKTAVGDSTVITMNALKDLAGSMIATNTKASYSTGVSAKTIAIKDNNAIFKSKNTVEVVFDGDIKTVEPSAIKIMKGDSVYTSPISVKLDGAKATFTLAKNLESTDAKDYTVLVHDETKVENMYGVKGFAKVETITSVDEIKPEIKEVAVVKDSNGEEVANQIKITFTEDLTVTKANLDDLVIKEGSKLLVDGAKTSAVIKEVTTKDNTITITLDKDVVAKEDDERVTLTISAPAPTEIKDTALNVLSIFDGKEITITLEKTSK